MRVLLRVIGGFQFTQPKSSSFPGHMGELYPRFSSDLESTAEKKTTASALQHVHFCCARACMFIGVKEVQV